MNHRRSKFIWVVLALAGLVVAGGVSYAASRLAQPSVGLTNEPVSAGVRLAPVRAREHRPTSRPQSKPHHKRGSSHGGSPTQATPAPVPAPAAVPPPAPPATRPQPAPSPPKTHGGDDSSNHTGGGHGGDD